MLVSCTKEENWGLTPPRSRVHVATAVRKNCQQKDFGQTGLLTAPNQLGCGTKGDAEAGLQATRKYISQSVLSELPSRKVVVKIYFRSAFNELHRQKALAAVREFMPEYCPSLWQSYPEPTSLFFDGRIILSQCGVQQSDPLNPAVFALTVAACPSEFRVSASLTYGLGRQNAR